MAAAWFPDVFFKVDKSFVFALRDGSSTMFLGRIQKF
jgi:hypothetical protein